MPTVTMYDIWLKCPKCGWENNRIWEDWVQVGETDGPEGTIDYKIIKHVMCNNEKCNHRWEKE